MISSLDFWLFLAAACLAVTLIVLSSSCSTVGFLLRGAMTLFDASLKFWTTDHDKIYQKLKLTYFTQVSSDSWTDVVVAWYLCTRDNVEEPNIADFTQACVVAAQVRLQYIAATQTPLVLPAFFDYVISLGKIDLATHFNSVMPIDWLDYNLLPQQINDPIERIQEMGIYTVDKLAKLPTLLLPVSADLSTEPDKFIENTTQPSVAITLTNVDSPRATKPTKDLTGMKDCQNKWQIFSLMRLLRDCGINYTINEFATPNFGYYLITITPSTQIKSMPKKMEQLRAIRRLLSGPPITL
jgi:hypothetical protein